MNGRWDQGREKVGSRTSQTTDRMMAFTFSKMEPWAASKEQWPELTHIPAGFF